MKINSWGLLCFIFAITFYFMSPKSDSKEDEFLKSATRIHKLKDLEGKVFPLIIAVSGIVGSETALIKCEHSDILGVILEETVEQEFLKRNWKFSWFQESETMDLVSKEVLWYLDDGTGRVNVSRAHDATGLVLTFGSDVFEKAEPSSFFQRIFDNIRGLKLLGIRRVERVLETGTQLTVVGEAVKDGIGNVKIQRSEEGFFYVTPKQFDQLISDPGKWPWCFKFVSIGLAILGVILMARDEIVYCKREALDMTTHFLERRQRQRRQREWEREQEREREEERQRLLQNIIAAVGKEASKRPEPVTRDLESQHENSGDLCVVCLEEKYSMVFVPCRHMCCCIACSSKVKTCPLCREPINEVLKIFRH